MPSQYQLSLHLDLYPKKWTSENRGTLKIEGIGKGLRGALRDALVADLTPLPLRGSAYGLRQALDTVGAFSGPLLAIGLMLLWQNQFHWVFWVAVLPDVLSVVLLLVAVRIPARPVEAKRVPLHWQELRRLNRGYWWVVAVGAVFTLACFSEAFLVLRAQRAGLPLAWVPLVLWRCTQSML